MLVTDLVADTFFVADVFLNFNTGYIKEQVVGPAQGLRRL